MSDGLVDVRTPLAASENVRIEVGRDGSLHVVTSMITLHLSREHCEEPTTTLARGLVRLHKMSAPRKQPQLRVVGREESSESGQATSRPR